MDNSRLHVPALRTLAAALVTLVAGLAATPGASAALDTTRDPAALSGAFDGAGALDSSSWSLLPRAETDSGNPLPSPHAVATTKLTGFPTQGSSYSILTTGQAKFAPQKNTEKDTGYEIDFVPVRDDSDYDTSVLRLDFNAPPTANCASFDFRFLSEEYPEYVKRDFNDAFIAELDVTNWHTADSEITAPNNFATDENGDLISIDSAGATSFDADFADGTTYDGATRLLNAATPISPGPHTLYLSIFDQGDAIYDSAVFLDNLRVDHRAGGECRVGADPVSSLPKTKIISGPGKKTKSRNATFKFEATGVNGASFECKLDKGAFKPCKSPEKLKNLSYGKHTFQVRAVGDDPDTSPAKSTFTVVKKK